MHCSQCAHVSGAALMDFCVLWTCSGNSGLHGVNRLGGNALTECLVFGQLVGESIPLPHKQQSHDATATETESVRRYKLQTCMYIVQHKETYIDV